MMKAGTQIIDQNLAKDLFAITDIQYKNGTSLKVLFM